MIRLSDLRDKAIRTADGERLGRVHEVHCEGGRVTALMCGSASLIERWTARKQGRRIPWEVVDKVNRDSIVLAPPSKKPARTKRRRST